MGCNCDRAKKIILAKYSDSIINSIMETPDSYIFNIQPKDWDDNDYVLDGFFKVSKTDGDLSEYSPVMDVEEFKAALKNIIYERKR